MYLLHLNLRILFKSNIFGTFMVTIQRLWLGNTIFSCVYFYFLMYFHFLLDIDTLFLMSCTIIVKQYFYDSKNAKSGKQYGKALFDNNIEK